MDKIYPCAYTLLPNKKSDTYDQALFKLKQLLDYSPKTIHIDFEQAVIKAIKNIFPNCMRDQRLLFPLEEEYLHQYRSQALPSPVQ